MALDNLAFPFEKGLSCTNTIFGNNHNTMKGLNSIPIHIEDANSGNALPLLHEVRHALEKLLDTGEETNIDLHSLPMESGDDALLEKILGKGEVEAQLNALGTSTVRETIYPGVWLIYHYNQEQQLIARFLEITFIPEILKSQREDIRSGLEELASKLSQTKADTILSPSKEDKLDVNQQKLE